MAACFANKFVSVENYRFFATVFDRDAFAGQGSPLNGRRTVSGDGGASLYAQRP
jgi:hypothetical protein